MKQDLHVIATPDGPRVATSTSARPARPDGLCAILPNTGLNARVGPHRINVRIARHLAEVNHLDSVRVDLAGLGDSPPSTAARAHEEQAVADLRAVMDERQQATGASRFVIVGICSGAYDGWLAALEDPRVVGLVMVDGPAYPSPKTRRAAAMQALKWRPASESAAWLVGKVKLKLGVATEEEPVSAGEDAPPEDDDTPFPTLDVDTFARQAQTLVDRGVAIYMINTSTWRRFYSYPEQFQDVFGQHRFAPQIQVDYEPSFDHTFSRVDAQLQFLARVSDWIAARFPAPV